MLVAVSHLSPAAAAPLVSPLPIAGLIMLDINDTTIRR
jgi:hypothetical protein